MNDTPIFPRMLRREIILLICIKIAVLAILYEAFFAPHEIAPFSRGAMEGHILGPLSGH